MCVCVCIYIYDISSLKVNERHSLSMLRVIHRLSGLTVMCTVAGEWGQLALPVMWSDPSSLEQVMKGQNNIKILESATIKGQNHYCTKDWI